MRSRDKIEKALGREDWTVMAAIDRKQQLSVELLLDIRDLLSILIQKQVQGPSAELGTRTAGILLDLIE